MSLETLPNSVLEQELCHILFCYAPQNVTSTQNVMQNHALEEESQMKPLKINLFLK
jgi:hypothetical protein